MADPGIFYLSKMKNYTPTPLYPFSAIVGQKELKLALILCLINPSIGGVLIRGEKGTGKSTIVRSIERLMPNVGVVTLPLNATLDAIKGGIDIEHAIKYGKIQLEPGVLYKAHKNILYIDEVNLLDDYIVELLLDVSEAGVNILEREGISLSHESRFILIGSMNPEEGELSPHFVDRFGLCVDIKGEKDPFKRLKIIKNREEFEKFPSLFEEKYRHKNHVLYQKIKQAKHLLNMVYIPPPIKEFIVTICMEKKIEGHRGELILAQAALAYAAFRGKKIVSQGDVIAVSKMVLRHRTRVQKQEKHSPPQPPKQPPLKNNKEQTNSPPPTQQNKKLSGSLPKNYTNRPVPSPEDPLPAQIKDKVFTIGEIFKVKSFSSPKDRRFRRGSGRRSRTYTPLKQGRYVRAAMCKSFEDDLALDATLRAAAPYQKFRKKQGNMAVKIERQDIRRKIREKKTGNLIIFVVDASGSMGARARMIATKGAIMSLLLDAYQKRDRVCLISFRQRTARLVLPPTSSIHLAARTLKELPIGGRTPLAHGLVAAKRLIHSHKIKDPALKPVVIIITDGRANVPFFSEDPVEDVFSLGREMHREDAMYMVIDTEEQGAMRLGLALHLAQVLGARYFQIKDIKADDMVNIVKEQL